MNAVRSRLQFTAIGKSVTLANTPVWDEETIEARTAVMVDKLVDLFRFPGE